MVSSKSIEGSLNNSDFILDSTGLTPIRADEFDLDLTGAVGQNLTISLSSTDSSFDPFLEVLDPITGQILKSDDNDGGGNNAQINNADNLTVPNNGKLRIRVTNSSFNPNLNSEENPYSLTVSLASDNIDVQLTSKETIFGDPETGSFVTIEGQLNTEDFHFTRSFFDTKADEYKLEAPTGQDVTIALNSSDLSAFDPFLQVIKMIELRVQQI